MAKFIIFVDEVLVGGSTRLAAANVGLNVGLGLAASLSLTNELELRRSALSGLAAALVGQQVVGGIAAASALSAMREAAVSSTPDFDSERVQILPGLSAIVVDDKEVDVASLNGVVGLTVVADMEVRLPPPITVAAAALTSDWHLQQIGLSSGTAGGNDILIGILDTGIDATHMEFAGKNIFFAEFDAAGRQISQTPRDAGDHGTHVCSIAAGALAGVAPNADLAVAAVLTTRTADGGMSGQLIQIANGFNWLITTAFRQGVAGVDVINASLGATGFNTFLRLGVQTAFGLGFPLIAAIGNNGQKGSGNHGSPGNYPEVLGVGATDPTDTVADFSDWGVGPSPIGPNYPVPILCAPGVQVYAAKPGGTFQYMSGTSMATPVVTGVAARRMATKKALVGNPATLFADLKSGLVSCKKGLYGNLWGGGRIIA